LRAGDYEGQSGQRWTDVGHSADGVRFCSTGALFLSPRLQYGFPGTRPHSTYVHLWSTVRKTYLALSVLRTEVNHTAWLSNFSDSDTAPHKIKLLPSEDTLWQRSSVTTSVDPPGITGEDLFLSSGRRKEAPSYRQWRSAVYTARTVLQGGDSGLRPFLAFRNGVLPATRATSGRARPLHLRAGTRQRMLVPTAPLFHLL
jgi:hypothetical protein